MRRKLLYLIVVTAVLALLATAATASLLGLSALALVATACLAAASCLMLVEQRWSQPAVHRLDRMLPRLDRLATSVDAAARRDEVGAVAASLASLDSHHESLEHYLQTISDEQARASDAFEGISRRSQRFHTEVRSGLRTLRHEPLVLQIAALLQLDRRFAPQAPLIAAGAWALSPTVVVEIVDTVAQRRPHLVVECGSGLSTVWLGYALKEAGHGRLVALEHDATYRAQTLRMVEQHGLSDVVEVRLAPLTPTLVGNTTMPWYSAPLHDLQDIGVLLVDGPPAATGAGARYPALPLLRHGLAPGAAIILDDIVRDDERAVVSRWLEEDPTLAISHELPGGAIALGVR